MSVVKEKAEQIKKFYLFHKKIELKFTDGFIPFFEYRKKGLINAFLNPQNVNLSQKFYVIDNDWI